MEINLQRLLDIAQLIVYLIVAAVFIYLGIWGGVVMKEISDDLKQNRIQHESLKNQHNEFRTAIGK